jgi:hypothetical protein
LEKQAEKHKNDKNRNVNALQTKIVIVQKPIENTKNDEKKPKSRVP